MTQISQITKSEELPIAQHVAMESDALAASGATSE